MGPKSGTMTAKTALDAVMGTKTGTIAAVEGGSTTSPGAAGGEGAAPPVLTLKIGPKQDKKERVTY